MYKNLVKVKSIATAPAFPDAITTKLEALKPPQDINYANITGRLFKSDPVQKAKAEAIDKARHALGLDEELSAPKKRLRKADFEAQERGGKTVDEAQQAAEFPSKSDSPQGHEVIMQVSDGDQEELRLQEGRTAGDSSGEGEGDVVRHDSEASDDSVIEDFTEADGISITSTESDPRPKSDKRAKTSARPSSTTFIPSLTMGGYWSGSESQPDTSDDEAAKIQPRKNRRGQQARRAIWEAKYGSNANHVKMQKNRRDDGWHPKKGAQMKDSRLRDKGRGAPLESAGAPGKLDLQASGTKGNSLKAKDHNKQDTGPLHPSWEAAKKRKEQKQIPAFEGKKVVFD